MNGYKTYIVAALTAALTFAHAQHWVDDNTFATLLGLLGAGGLATLRNAIPPKP